MSTEVPRNLITQQLNLDCYDIFFLLSLIRAGKKMVKITTRSLEDWGVKKDRMAKIIKRMQEVGVVCLTEDGMSISEKYSRVFFKSGSIRFVDEIWNLPADKLYIYLHVAFFKKGDYTTVDTWSSKLRARKVTVTKIIDEMVAEGYITKTLIKTPFSAHQQYVYHASTKYIEFSYKAA